MAEIKTENQNQLSAAIMMIGIVSSFTIADAQMLLSPALSQLADKFPDVSYSTMTYMSTLPSLLGIPMSIIAGWLIKNGVKYKTILLTSIALIIIGGFAPYFLNSFPTWIASRTLFGIGFGCGIPVSGSITMASFRGDALSRAQGLGSVVQNLTGVLLPFIAGMVCAINVDYVWFLHFLYLIPFILVMFFVREPEAPRQENENMDNKNNKTKVPGGVYFMSIAYGLIFMFIYPIILNMAGILLNENLGTASLSGTMTALFFAGGMVSGAIFPSIYKKTGANLIPLLCLGAGAGMLIAYLGHNVPMLIAGNIIVGICSLMIWPASLTRFGDFVPAGALAMAGSLFGFCINLFSFLASPYSSIVANILGSNPRVHLLVGAVGCVVVGVIYFIFKNNTGKTAE